MWVFHLMVPAVEILIIAIIVYYLLSFFWNTRAMDLLYGSLAFLAFFALSKWFNLPVLEKLMYYVVNVAVVAFLIIFQPELRLALSKLSLKSKKYREVTEFDKFLESISQSIYRLSERRIGALVVLENQDSLEDLANKAVLINAQFSPELLESIFITTTPLHDGAVIIRGTTILSGATILPLADDSTHLSKSMGTRHRAGLGISQLTDALVIVVSEETGKVSIARDGIMTRGVKVDRFKGIIRSVFSPPKTTIPASLNLWEQIKLWNR
ncbi:MAG: TIGR00159 family protein [Candidatus Protochlamydia sp.]|nr:TIGR00159 family protein [Candidatus Protochlamydia sp.]